ncbi:MAG: FAD-dependent oxidoreductase, partial [Bacteroidia bacterium]|nr:FAD-dependent oxidoreductase [Bacteroidia bacterium]
MSKEHVVIIGNGISGITLARHIRKLSAKKITIISDETEHFFSRTALMYIYMGHMTFEQTKPYEDWFWEKNKIELKQGNVISIDARIKSITLENKETIGYDKLVIATGSLPNKFGWPGEDLKGVQGLYHLRDLHHLEAYAPNNKVCKRAVIVGGGLIGIELAEMLVSRNIPVTFLVREKSFWNNVLPAGESEMINNHIRNHRIDLRLGVNLEEIKEDENGRAKSIIIQETKEEIACNFVGLTAGVSPNIAFLNSSEIEVGKGVLVNQYLETNVDDIYAIGDCA